MVTQANRYVDISDAMKRYLKITEAAEKVLMRSFCIPYTDINTVITTIYCLLKHEIGSFSVASDYEVTMCKIV